MEYKEIKELIRLINNSDIGELAIKEGDFNLKIVRKDYVKKIVQSTAAAMPQMVAPAIATPAAISNEVLPAKESQTAEKSEDKKADTNNNYITIKSPMIGTFYRSPSPDKEPYVKVGDQINVGDVLCVVEAMKLFNEIESEVSGKIIKVLIDNSSPVEYDQPLFLIEPQ